MAAAVAHSARAETTASLASSFENLNLKIKAKPKEGNDPLKVLDPVRKKLTSVEAQRVVAVADETIRRIEVVTLLPYITENLDRFSVILGSDLCSVLREHDRLQDAYRKGLARYELEQKRNRSTTPQQIRFQTPGSSRKSSLASEDINEKEHDLPITEAAKTSRHSSLASGSGISQKEDLTKDRDSDGSEVDVDRLQHLGVLVQNSIRTVLRMFSTNPTAITALKKERRERSVEANSMIDELLILRAILFERLLTTPSEVKDRSFYLKTVMEREKKSRAIANKLQEELQKAVDDKDNEISKRNEMIRKLKNDIYTIDSNSEEQNRRVVNEASKQETAEMKNSDGKKSKLQQEIIEQKKKLDTERAAHRASELALRKRKYKIETEVENWIQKFDSDMGERQDEFDALDVVYTEEKKQLQELEERFKTLEKEYLQIVEERRIAKERAEAAERELNMKIRAARLIQAMWRAHKARKALQKKKKKGKKGKKGKKSGKGKKK
ncbi:dynein regulatory complex protein 10-like [Actinia tenebrosa]|uniref:Dynein regulatory complex protein 10 n=1 Tax=Actinia tenebrosa TaxID=6105 RepID=A0A6P8HU79_ACTTE|nr:dynein regulatory complex protein 10-like [Actinia tenebrosa]